ncbi:uncharacterized protein PAC_12575 [Phialocephala subalpina]|uniref:Uncharacterized protein n=1 Tax=Phialocephala subalpina TaxID=576137 RepID=A0A1L7XCD5_9HELO|nr:uncharacterized protein PAC_12575 [Phialocephala subalpina]
MLLLSPQRLSQAILAVSNPISIESAVVLGNQTSSNDPGTYRDGGWESQIGNTYFQFYADTLHCDVNNAANNCELSTFHANTLALSTSNPQVVTEFVTPYPAAVCDAGASGYRLHLTNIISLSSTTGFAFYVNISSDTSVDIDGEPVGSGVATITYTGSGQPSCSVTPQFWGESEPLWGTNGAIGHNLDGYIYFLGSLSSGAPGGNYSDVYVGRVAPGSQTTLSAYQYWDGTEFSSNRLYNPNFNGWSPSAVMTSAPQGSITYNNYYNCYIYLFPGPALSAQILASTAQTPNGPWTSPVTVFQGNNLYYAPVAQGHFDTSGKTLIFDMSIFSPIYLETVKLTFN